MVHGSVVTHEASTAALLRADAEKDRETGRGRADMTDDLRALLDGDAAPDELLGALMAVLALRPGRAWVWLSMVVASLQFAP